MKYKTTISYLVFIISTLLFILVSSICHDTQEVLCFSLSFLLFILMFGSMIISIALLMD